jgi:hypothetical protein
VSPDLDAPAMRVIDQEQVGFRVFRQISERYVLAISDEIHEGDRLLIEHLQKSGWSTPVLNGRLPVQVCGGQEDAALRFDEAPEFGCDAGLP